MRGLIFVSALVGMLSFAFPACAETVQIISGHSEGQGWAFLRRSGCYVATAGHVIPKSDAGQVFRLNGQSAEIEKVFRHPELDLAVARLRGSLAENCPASGLGDQNSLPLLRKISNEGRVVKFERLTGRADTGDGAFGLDTIAIEVLSMTGNAPQFFFQVVGFKLDSNSGVIQSDSGSPIRMRGQGFGEAGLPLGLVTAQDFTDPSENAFAIRMDAVRSFVEQLNLDNIKQTEKPKHGFTIVSTTGLNADPECGALNLEKTDAACGWRAKRGAGVERISITVRLEKQTKVSSASIGFENGDAFSIAAVSARMDGGDWYYPRPCPNTAASGTWTCSVADWLADEVRVEFEAKSIEIKSIQIQ